MAKAMTEYIYSSPLKAKYIHIVLNEDLYLINLDKYNGIAVHERDTMQQESWLISYALMIKHGSHVDLTIKIFLNLSW